MSQNRLMKQLSEAFGPPGFEDDVVAVLQAELTGLGIAHQTDRLKNLYAKLEQTDKPIVQLDAHMDEVGFMIQRIRPDGMLPFITLGGIRPINLGGQRVLIKNLAGQVVKGIIATIPPHFNLPGQSQEPTIESLYIDVGARSAEEVRQTFKIEVGCPGVYDTLFEANDELGIYHGRAFDCRIGCAALTMTLAKLKNQPLEVSLIGAYSVQEELGMRGAVVTANTVRPDVAIVFEGAPADDMLSLGAEAQTCLGKGPMLRHFDQGMVTHPGFQQFAIATAKQAGIPIQQAVRTGGKTNGASIHLSAQGVPTIVISIPVRYIHTGNNFAMASDLTQAVDLAAAIVRQLNQTIIDQL